PSGAGQPRFTRHRPRRQSTEAPTRRLRFVLMAPLLPVTTRCVLRGRLARAMFAVKMDWRRGRWRVKRGCPAPLGRASLLSDNSGSDDVAPARLLGWEHRNI